MLRMNATTLVFALVLILGGSAAEKSLKINVPEDELFWARELQDQSMSVAPTPAPVECAFTTTVTCTVGEGVECNSFTPEAGDCIQEISYDYSFQNTGSIPLDITKAESQVGTLAPVSILPFLEPTTLLPGQSTKYSETKQVDFCVEQTITTFVRAEATPGPCEDEVTYVLKIVGVTPPAPTPPAPTPPAPTPPAPTPPAPTPPAPTPPAPTPPAPTPPPPTPPAPTPPAPTPEGCGLDISIQCATGEGIECKEYIVPVGSDRCLQDITYVYTFVNNGIVELDITEATSQWAAAEPTNLLQFIVPTTIVPGASTTVSEQRRVDYCNPENVVATVRANAISTTGPCEAEVIYEFIPMPAGRRALRGN